MTVMDEVLVPQSYRILAESDLYVAISNASGLPWLQSCPNVERSLVGTIISELGHNMLKYAGGGQLSIGEISQGDQRLIEIVAEDNGPGIVDVEAALRDHVSSGGTLGLGLPGVRRMADAFHIDTAPGLGTRVTVRKCLPVGPVSMPALQMPCESDRFPGSRSNLTIIREAPNDSAAQEVGRGRAPTRGLLARPEIELACRTRPHVAEALSGDAVVVIDGKHMATLVVVDVLGHGPEASTVALQMADLIQARSELALPRLMQFLHAVLQGQRGAAAGLVRLNQASASLSFLGVGNIAIRRLGAHPWSGVSRDGVLGQRLPSLLEQQIDLSAGDVVVMHSDGIKDLRTSELSAQLLLNSAAAIAQHLISKHSRPFDDASCVVLKCRQ